jgi:hypothetical protein
MPHSAIEGYMSQLEKNRAILRMMMGEAAKLPHMEDEGRREWAADVNEKINGGSQRKQVAPRAVLKMIGIGVRE